MLHYRKAEKEVTNQYRRIFFSDQELSYKNYWNESFSFGQNYIFDIDSLMGFFDNDCSIIRAKGCIRGNSGRKFVNYALGENFIEECPEKDQNQITIIAENSVIESMGYIKSEIEKFCTNMKP